MAAKDIEQFKMKKGTTLNPKGRPKGTKNRSTIARKWLEVNEKQKNPISQKEELMCQEDIMTLALIKKARNGDVAAYRELMDSAYGKANQQMDVTTDGEKINVVPSKLSIEVIK